MGCQKLADSSAEPLWIQYRDQFPVTGRLVYLNHAAVAPLPRVVADAMRDLAEDACLWGSFHYDRWLAAYEGVRVAAARLINAGPDEIAIVKNTSEGIATIATGLDWRPGDRMVAFREEFPANYYPWKILEGKGLGVEWLSVADPLDRIDQAATGARLLSISFVQYLSGYRADLEAIGEICHRRGCLFLVDAIQGLGAFPVDVRRARIHALAADGHKWLLGPEGCGILYIQRDIQDAVEPVEFGWTNVAKYADYASRDMSLRPDAGRYECGTLNTVGIFGLRAALEFLLEVGIERITPQIQARAAEIAEGVRSRGCEVMLDPRPETGSGIVTFRKPGLEDRAIVNRLRAEGIVTAPRQGWVRVSPHFYISPADIGRMIEALP
ncbi:MAG: aminotransferase class V-fold PLP-dependent enzyme [Acidobacteria bacterium]|nr:aminotransferase class V-fold PLP-dependent enzyme [Acidobacteriota bacterium]MBI3281533.1 aminotransferase class V-fold PLP-dependent enzyme [Acidobacteriota bacterium]